MKIVKAKNQKLTVSCKILRKSNALDNHQLRQVFMTPKKSCPHDHMDSFIFLFWINVCFSRQRA